MYVRSPEVRCPFAHKFEHARVSCGDKAMCM
jgi:hypothetical protein